MQVEDYMHTRPITITAEDLARTAYQRMRECRIRHLRHARQRRRKRYQLWHWLAAACAVLLSLTLWIPGQAQVTADAPASSFQATMRDIFQALTTVFPLSLNAQQFQDPAQHQRLLAGLRTLAQQAERLGTHGQDVPPHLDFLRRSLASDAQIVLQRYEQAQYQAARFTLHRLTEHCFACHAKLPTPRRFALGQRFLAEVPLANLSLKERARLAVATRQFDTALEIYETLFQSPAMTAADIGLMGAFEDYFKLVFRVQNDSQRALRTLETFRQRPDIPYSLLAYLDSWVKALQEIHPVEASDDALSAARTLIREGQQRNRFPADRLGLVHFVVASSLLHRSVDTNPVAGSPLAEAYYLLGVAESSISRTLWMSETEFFLETAIRLAPMSTPAGQAYAFLEEYVLAQHMGSSGLHLPADVRAHLEELRRLVDGS